MLRVIQSDINLDHKVVHIYAILFHKDIQQLKLEYQESLARGHSVPGIN